MNIPLVAEIEDHIRDIFKHFNMQVLIYNLDFSFKCHLKALHLSKEGVHDQTTSNFIIRIHVRIMYTPLLYSKAGVCRGIPFFLTFAQNIDCGYSLEPARLF